MKKETIDNVNSFLNRIREYGSYIVMAICLLLSYFVKFHIINILNKLVERLQVCSHNTFAFGICIAVALSSVYLIWKICEKMRYVAHRTVAIATFWEFVYVYFRFVDHSYTFWGWSPYFVWMDLLLIPFILLWVEKLTYQPQPEEGNYDYKIVSDSPICDFTEDAFGHSKTINTMIDNFNSLDLSKGAYSVGIVGEWGQGKTSFLNLFCKSVVDKCIVVRFNPRSAKSVDRIQDEFFCALSDELSKYHTGIKRYFHEYAIAVEAADEGWIGKLATIIDSLTPDEQKERINTAIEKIGKRVYVIVEDLDRLTGQEIIEVLKLIDGNGDFCNTIFMTAYDKLYVNEILKNYLVPSITQDYTDKYFNYEYNLPTPTSFALKTYFKQYLNSNIKQVDDDLLTQKQMLDTWSECSDFVVRNLRTMRHIKRFINLFMTRYPKVKNDVDMRDYIYVTLLRYTDIRTYSALCEGRLLTRGSYLNGSTEILYQSEQAKEVLETIGAKASSKVILNLLFPEKGMEGTLEEAYNRAKWAANTDRYFFDYKIAVITHSKGIALFRVVDDKAAFELVDEYLREGYSQSLSNFLRSRTPMMIGDADGLCRLTKLIAYLDKKDRTADLDGYMMRLMCLDEFKDYERAGVIKDQSLFKNVVDTAMTFMLDYVPLEIGFACIRMINGIIEKHLLPENSLFSLDELVTKAECAQKYYFQKWGTAEFKLEPSLNVSAIRVGLAKGAEGYSYPARTELLSMMKLHPMEFAKMLIIHNVYDHNGKTLSLSFIKSFTENTIFPVDGYTMADWIDNSFTDEKVKYVLHAVAGNDMDFLQVRALKDEYKHGDFEGYYEAVKRDSEEKLDKDIQDYIKHHVGFDLFMISFDTNKSADEVKASLRRLVNLGSIPSWYLNLKEKMDDFNVGDYVRLRDKVFENEKGTLFYKTNVYKIEEIVKPETAITPSYKLSDLSREFDIEEIEAIPIDGVHDVDIYYDPINAASVIAPGQPIPVHHTDYSYYMEHFKRCTYNDKTYVEFVINANCQFVHEVQHYMRDELGGCELKINHK